MRLIVDGLIYELQAHGGVSRVCTELLPRMCLASPELHVSLLTSGAVRQPLPRHPQISARQLPPLDKLPFGKRLWWRTRIGNIARAMVQCRAVPRNHQHIWHSSYYTVPAGSRTAVVTVHDLIHERYPNLFTSVAARLFRKQKARCIARAELLVAVSEATRADLQEHYDVADDRIVVVPHGVGPPFGPSPEATASGESDHADDDPGSGTIPAEGDEPFLLFIGRRSDEHKNFWGFMEAYRRWDLRRHVGVVVVGKPWTVAERRGLERLGLSSRVRLVLPLDDVRLSRTMRCAAALVYPSLYEGFGLPVLEALACGCPVVASRIPSTLEVAADIPHYFEPGSADAFIAALDAAIAEGRKGVRVQRGLDAARARTWQQSADTMLSAYRRVE